VAISEDLQARWDERIQRDEAASAAFRHAGPLLVRPIQGRHHWNCSADRACPHRWAWTARLHRWWILRGSGEPMEGYD
tara:strand:- start:725 stop:958 length:234 start_codon:yes stop_codon:yes gene_type:complete